MATREAGPAGGVRRARGVRGVWGVGGSWGAGRVRRTRGLLRAEARAYVLLVRVAFREAAQYRTSLALRSLTEAAATVLDLAAIGIVFAHLPALEGFSLAEVAFLYGTSALAFALAEAFVGPVDRLGWHIRDGRFDVVLIRPVSVLVQTATMAFSPQRVARAAQPAVIVVVSCLALHVRWTPDRVLLVPAMVLCGAVLAASAFVATAAVLFVAPDATVAVAASTQGSALAARYPMTVYGHHLAVLLTVVLPIGFVSWLPALHVLSRADPLGLPTALRFASPLVAAVSAGLAALAWRAGVRRYRSTGS
ncbi:ABC-2 family transporter protein [Pseudofrankia sp. BMG5.37]|uniref:ABC transporter permease n=1 Tax=Pseudofrankia sp. BMG5.37 TaxID=3050035 RepID=UPI000A4DEAFB|nr:ABC-2 family transporter protein [Pseudofrankia sp. BMG5.37]